ncbi:MAG: hypothetical protein H0V02_03970, partial [Nocardioidaceae bacterium]|nr:hypothetical protein [Nocardioidaceae bacterium]
MSAQHDEPRAAGEPRAAYDIEATQEKWLKVWADLDPFKAVDDGSRERRYLLDMFPY